MGLMRAEPPGRVREPMPEGGTPHVRDLREFVDTGAACEAPDVEPCQFDALLTVTVCADITDGGQDRRSRGCATARQWQQPLDVPTRRKERQRLREPQVVFSQSVCPIVRQGFPLTRVETGGGCATETLCGHGVARRPWLAGPWAAATPGLPRCQEASRARAHEGLWRGMALKKPHSGWRCQVLAERRHRWTREVHGGSSLVAPLAALCLEGHMPPHQAVGGQECRITGNGQKALALSSYIADTGSIFCIGFTGPVRHGVPMVAHGWAGHQADRRATAGESCGESLPRETGRCHGEQEALPPVLDHGGLAGLCQALEALTGGGTCELATAQSSRRTSASMRFGLAHIDSHEE
jgi:hypothetical protein